MGGRDEGRADSFQGAMKERWWKQEIPLLVDNFPFPIRPLCPPTEQADPSKEGQAHFEFAQGQVR